MSQDFRKPLTRSRAEWEPVEDDEAAAALRALSAATGGERDAEVWERRTGDGVLRVIVSLGPYGWHLSISFRDHRGRLSRYPRWDEIADARYRFIPQDVTMCMVLPPPDEYISVHDTTFQLHDHNWPRPWLQPGPDAPEVAT